MICFATRQARPTALEYAVAVPALASRLHVSGKEDSLLSERMKRQKHRVLFSLDLLSVRDPMHAIFNVMKCVVNLMLIIAYHMEREVYNRLVRALQAAVGKDQIGIPKPAPGQRVAAKIAKSRRCRGPQLRAILKAEVYTALPESSRERYEFQRSLANIEGLYYSLMKMRRRSALHFFDASEAGVASIMAFVDELHAGALVRACSCGASFSVAISPLLPCPNALLPSRPAVRWVSPCSEPPPQCWQEPLYEMFPGDIALCKGELVQLTKRDAQGDLVVPPNCRVQNRGPGSRSSHYLIHILPAFHNGEPSVNTDKAETSNNGRREMVSGPGLGAHAPSV